MHGRARGAFVPGQRLLPFFFLFLLVRGGGNEKEEEGGTAHPHILLCLGESSLTVTGVSLSLATAQLDYLR